METVLLVDDDRLILTMLGDFVREGMGLRALTAESGAAALEILETERADLVFLDIIMPGMDGLETLRRIKERWPSIPVVILTGSASMENAIAALREGADDFFRKPADLDELSLCVARALSRKQMVRHLPPPLPVAGLERRLAARIRVNGGEPAQLFCEVFLIEISLSGALIEHAEPVNPGEIYRLCFAAEGREVQVLARTIRALPSHRVRLAGDERQIVYRTGMEFVGVEKDSAQVISQYVDRLKNRDPAGTTT